MDQRKALLQLEKKNSDLSTDLTLSNIATTVNPSESSLEAAGSAVRSSLATFKINRFGMDWLVSLVNVGGGARSPL